VRTVTGKRLNLHTYAYGFPFIEFPAKVSAGAFPRISQKPASTIVASQSEGPNLTLRTLADERLRAGD
jgi:hypothetical protein